MKYRELGSTGIKVSEIGFGAWQLGDKSWGNMEKETAIELVHKAIEEGCNFFDTAPIYGDGQSEKLLGEALHGRRDKVVIVTKFGHNPFGESDFSASKIRSSVERSLKNLKTDYLDGVLLHNAESEILKGNGGHFGELEKLKQEGKIRAYGASLDTTEDFNLLMDNSKSQIAEILFHAFNQDLAKDFKKASDKGIGLIIKVPLDSGWLAGKYNASTVFKTGYRDRWSQEVKERRSALVDKLSFLKNDKRSMAQGALRFTLSFNEISTIIPGTRNIDQLKSNMSASDGQLSDIEINKVKDLWEKEINGNPLPW